jgi:peptidoglycan biosynthesis protein MviN/MurJ (putative lipid II flippase)
VYCSNVACLDPERGAGVKFLAAFSMRVRDAHPDHHAIFKGMAWVMLFVLLGKLIGAAKEMAVAYRYGAGAEVDAYLFVLNIVSWPIGLWFSVLTVVLIPAAARMRQNSARQLPRFRAELLGSALLFGLVLTAAIWLGLFFLLRSPWSGLPPATSEIAERILPSLMTTVPLGILASLFSVWMLAGGRYVNTLMEGLPSLVIAVTILAVTGYGIEPLVWGTVLGAALYMIVLGMLLRRSGDIEAPRFNPRSSQWSAFLQGFGIMFIGNALMSLIIIIDLLFTVRLGTGAVATLGYANRVLALIVGLGGTAATRATLPVFSSVQGQKGKDVYRLAMQWAHLMFAFGAVAMVFVWWLAPYAIRLLFERGAFTSQDTSAVTEVLRYGALQLPFYFSALVLVSCLATGGAHKLLALGAVVNLCIKFVGNIVFVPVLGINGIMLATGLMYLVSFAMLYWMAFAAGKRGEKE